MSANSQEVGTSINRIEREVTIEAPPERVWDLLTEAEHVGTWFSDGGAEIDLTPGGEMTLRWVEHGTYRARVERVDPPRFFSYRGAISPEAEPDESNSTLVEFSLAPEGNGTRVRVVESGFDRLDLSDEERRAHLDGNREGWRIEFGHLADYAAKLSV
jgi:uncharacterized protein YndB with AHSA1/START domain